MLKWSFAARAVQVSPFLVTRRTVSTRTSGGARERYDIPRLTERRYLHMEQHEIAFSDDQEWSNDDDSPVHLGGGGTGRTVACTTTASDETKARMEIKAVVEMAYMVKQKLRQNVFCSNGGPALRFIPA